ncbi:UDP-2,3-diacylglucosamine diphosphatase [Salisaeta longa]|uniref:UDP-2,3-diacylglucosamine diphosphatase n=1 Tax=Salisaeta longa TaxID=503170 RepID=UPI000401E4FD|nr:UDP-2,3-diacylglucosamine diphosphatase [Salisaeta longa]
MASRTRYRTIWLSDIHLGMRASKASFVLDFLEHHQADALYLVGDIFDGWALQRSWYWPPSHNEVVQALLQIARHADVTYIPGNHDEAARRFPGLSLGGITIRDEALHTTADGRQFLVLHGDAFDGVVRHARWLSVLGGMAYNALLRLNRPLNRMQRWLGRPYWSLSSYLKRRTKRAVQFIADFEAAVARRARSDGADGVICGHIHHAEMRMIDGVQYVNTGDWVESCTALVEHYDGRLEIKQWVPSDRGPRRVVAAEPQPQAFAGDGQDTALPVFADA